MGRRKLEKVQKALEKERKEKAADEERERQAWADRRKKIEQMKAQERADRKRREKEANGDDDDDEPEPEPKKKKKYKDDDNKPSNKKKPKKKKNDTDDDDDDDDDSNRKPKKPKQRRQRNEPKAPTKDYKIFFSVNIQTEENDDIGEVEKLRPLLADLFDTRSEKDVFEIKTRKKGNGFKIDFGIIIATSMHPADYIDTFDDLTMDGSFQETIKEGFEMDEDPHVHIWEARYEKIDPKKRKKKEELIDFFALFYCVYFY